MTGSRIGGQKSVTITEHDDVSRETVRRRLAENDLKPWRKDMWCIPQVDGEYVARMEDVLDLRRGSRSKTPGGLLRREPDAAQPVAAEPGRLERYDCEYKRNGTVRVPVPR
jgi:hypothetical protein